MKDEVSLITCKVVKRFEDRSDFDVLVPSEDLGVGFLHQDREHLDLLQ